MVCVRVPFSFMHVCNNSKAYPSISLYDLNHITPFLIQIAGVMLMEVNLCVCVCVNRTGKMLVFWNVDY